jgi:hypothetical protein
MTRVNAAFITPTCREGRGDQDAWDEAVRRLKVEYDAIVEGWAGRPEQPTITLALEMERPK